MSSADRLDDYWDDDWDDTADAEDLPWERDRSNLHEALRDVLSDDLADAEPEALDEALDSIFDSMSPAESFNFAKALQQIGKGAGQALGDPTVNQIVRTSLPLAGGAIGTVIGGPVGTALGSNLGSVAARALPASPSRPQPAAAGTQVQPGTQAASQAQPPAVAVPGTPAAGGSAAAAQGLVLTQQPDVLKGLLALALGDRGQKSVNGLPVASIMNMLSSVFGQAAADADELMYRGGGEEAGEAVDDFPPLSGRSLYTTLMDAENYDLAETAGAL